MTWSYSSASLGLTKNRVRLFVGDTDTSAQQLEDEEIQFVLDYESSTTLAAAVCADLLAGKYSRQMNTENGSLRISAAARMKHYMDLADRLRRGGAGDVPGDTNIIQATMYVGGASVAAKEALLDDEDNYQGPFRIGQDDNPENPDSGVDWDPSV